MSAADALPRIVLDAPADELSELIEQTARLVFKHPVAAQAAFGALVAAGREFADTPAGRDWKTRLADSELVRRGRALWEGSALNLLDQNPDGAMPAALLDAAVRALGSPAEGTTLLRLEADDALARRP